MEQGFAESIVIRLCKQPRSFEYISKNLYGLDPVEAMNVLIDMQQKGIIVKIEERWVVKQVPVLENLKLYPFEQNLFLEKYMGYFKFLKTPHPLDFEWRNSTESLNRMIARIQKYVSSEDSILLLGMPTLFATAIAKDILNPVTLIERNKPILNGLQTIITDYSRHKIIDADIFHLNPKSLLSHFCAVMDPPWYIPHFYQFMWVAANCIPVGGFVAVSIPPLSTRPNIATERIELFSFCQRLGLCLEILEPEQLHYAMPFFEFNALRAAGIDSILPFWRKGDFALFRKLSASNEERPDILLEKEIWIEREYKTVRIRVKINNEKERSNTKLEINHLVKGDILPSVSSRNKIRSQANIWSTGNRIYNVNNPKLFLESLDNVLENKVKSETDETVLTFLELLSSVEKKEFNNYIDWIYYEMERQIN